MAAASPPSPRSFAPRGADSPLLEAVVGTLLEWVVSSVEEVRARFHRNGSR
jgi:hypothetical protein